MAPERPRWAVALHGVAVWLAIGGICAFVVYRQQARAAAGGGAERVALKLQARYLIGLKSLGLPGDELLKQARSAFAEDRTRLAILAGELDGPVAALAELPEDEVTLRRLYAGEEVGEEGRQELERRLGWFGRLALAGDDEGARAALIAEARRTAYVVAGMAVGALLGGAAGVFVLVLVGVLAWMGHLKPALAEGRSLVYGETFALFLAVFLGLSHLAGLARAPGWDLGLSGAAMLASLLTLGWPVLRGLAWREVAEDIGLRPPRLLDVPKGVGTYLAALPLLLAGLLVMLALMAVQRWMGGQTRPPAHPVAGAAEGAPWWVWAQVFLAACVVAPLVEEIFFRGVLYTHLRRMWPGWHVFARFAFAALVSSFLFAVIHPPGWVVVPVLGGLATGFCLARELGWSLVPCMVAHALHNLAITLMLLLAAA